MAKLPPYLGFMQDAKTRNSNLLASYQCLGECTDLEADTYTLIILLLSYYNNLNGHLHQVSMHGRGMHCYFFIPWSDLNVPTNRLLNKILQSSGKKENFRLVILIIKLLITSCHLLV